MLTTINLAWQIFSVDLNTIDTWMKANAGSSYSGLSADYTLGVHFNDEPGTDARSAIASYWAALDSSSPEATNYMSASDRAAAETSDRAAKLASATAKLEALGLTANEIAALRG